MKHLQLEREAWLRTLNYMEEENIFFKTTLAYIIRNGINNAMLDQAEHFQSIFISKDTMIALLRHDILELSDISGYKKNIVKDTSGMTAMQDKIRAAMSRSEQELNQLKALFNAYTAKALV